MPILRAAMAAAMTFCVAVPAIAQSGHASGVIRDADGRAIRSAVVTASNPQADPAHAVAVSGDRGQWQMTRMAPGEWTFTVEAPGFAAQSLSATIGAGGTAPLRVSLVRNADPLPLTLDRNAAALIEEAMTLREGRRFDRAIVLLQQVRSKNPTLTTINLVLGDTYRQMAATEAGATARDALLTLALEAYKDALKHPDTAARAKTAIDAMAVPAAAPTTTGSRR